MSLGPVLDAALEAQAVCEKAGLPHCVIGGVALQRWGEPRFTADAALSVLVRPGQEMSVINQLLAALSARVDDAAEFAERTRVLLLHSEQGVGIVVVLGGLPFEARVIERASAWQLDGSRTLTTCSAENLLVMKAFAARDRDWADVTGILERQGRKLDLELVRQELRPLSEAKEEPEILDQFEQRIERYIGKN